MNEHDLIEFYYRPLAARWYEAVEEIERLRFLQEDRDEVAREQAEEIIRLNNEIERLESWEAEARACQRLLFEKDAEIGRLRALLDYGTDTDVYHKLRSEIEQLQATVRWNAIMEARRALEQGRKA